MLSAFPQCSIDLSDLSLFPHLVTLMWILTYTRCRRKISVKWWNARVAFSAFGIKLKGDVLSHVLGVLKTPPALSDLLGEFTGLGM